MILTLIAPGTFFRVYLFVFIVGNLFLAGANQNPATGPNSHNSKESDNLPTFDLLVTIKTDLPKTGQEMKLLYDTISRFLIEPVVD